MKYLALFIMLLLVTSCTKVLDLDLNEPSRKLVLYPILSNDKTILVRLSAPAGVLSENFPVLENGKVIISQNGNPVDTVLINPEGSGNSDVIPFPGESYEFTADASGYPQAYCEVLMPYPCEVVAIDTSYVNFHYLKEFCTHIRLKDDPSEKHFYRVTVYTSKYYEYYDIRYTSISKPQSYSNIPDYGFFRIYDGRYLLAQEQIDMTEKNGFRTEVGTEVYFSGEEYFFSDDQFNGKEFSFNVILIGVGIYAYTIEKCIVEVSSISEDYYKGVKSYATYGTREYSKLPYSEEVSIYSSVKGGYGFPVASSTVIDSSYVISRYH